MDGASVSTADITITFCLEDSEVLPNCTIVSPEAGVPDSSSAVSDDF